MAKPCRACEANSDLDHTEVHVILQALWDAICCVRKTRAADLSAPAAIEALLSLAATVIDELYVGEARRHELQKCEQFFRQEWCD